MRYVRPREGRAPAPQRGFTLVELMMVVVIISLLISIGAWGGQTLLESYRATDAAQRLSMLVRQAQATAAQNNQPVLLELDCDDSRPSYRLTGNRWDAGTNALAFHLYEEVDIQADYPGARIDTVGLSGDLACNASTTFTLDAASGSTFCGAENALRFLPGGGVETPEGLPMTIAFVPNSDISAGRQDRVQVIGIEPMTGRTRHFVRSGTNWVCK